MARRKVRSSSGYPKAPTLVSDHAGGKGFDLIASLGKQRMHFLPAHVDHQTSSGRVVSTPVNRDNDFQSRPMVFLVGVNGPHFQVGIPDFGYFQDNIGGTSDPLVDAIVGTAVKDTYGNIVRILEANTRRFVRDTILDNTINTGDAMGQWLNHYGSAYMALRSLEGWLDAGNFNEPCSKIANAINRDLFRLQADLNRLFSISVPYTFQAWLDRCCGPKCIDGNSVVLASQLFNSGAATDLSDPTKIDVILSGAESDLDILLGVTPPTNAGADFQRIMNTLALAYGRSLPPPKTLSMDPWEYAMVRTQMVQYFDTTAVKSFIAPTVNETKQQQIPIFAPSGASDSEAAKQYFTLFRSGVYSNISAAGSNTGGNQIGLFHSQLTAGQGTAVGVYRADLTFASLNYSSAGPQTINPTINGNDILPWLFEAENEAPSLTADARQFNDLDLFWVTQQFLSEETAFAWEQIWYQPLMMSRS